MQVVYRIKFITVVLTVLFSLDDTYARVTKAGKYILDLMYFSYYLLSTIYDYLNKL